jgi:hypothetical protein
MFWRTISRAGRAWPATSVPKSTKAGVAVSTVAVLLTPVPLRLTLCGDPGALLGSDSVARNEPVVGGRKKTSTEHDAPGASVLLEQLSRLGAKTKGGTPVISTGPSSAARSPRLRKRTVVPVKLSTATGRNSYADGSATTLGAAADAVTGTASATAASAAATTTQVRTTSRFSRAPPRSRPCAPARSGRTAGPSPRTPRSCPGCR